MTPQTPQLPSAVEIPASSVKHGEVYTQRWVVDMILDLVGYTPDRDLTGLTITDPACGTGAFLVAIAERLSQSCLKFDCELPSTGIQAFDILERNVETSRRNVEATLVGEGWERLAARDLAAQWVTQGDYLLQDQHTPADLVVGNPPYIRIEDVPVSRMDLYRRKNKTMTGRSDVYVGFYEQGLKALKPDGKLGFICADRWMRNQYGRELRKLISENYAVDSLIVMHDVDAFEDKVAAYPAITIIRSGSQQSAAVVDTSKELQQRHSEELVSWVKRSESLSKDHVAFRATRLPHWFQGTESWPMGSPERLALLEELSDRYPTLEETGVKVGIGVATGADSVFLTRNDGLVEEERLLPLSMVKDASTGNHEWTGYYLVNPWTEDGNLVALKNYPRLNSYFEENRASLEGRHVARKNPQRWFRTIDKVDASLTARPKLLFPDMKLNIHPTLERGGYYPHHNLYYMVSEEWDLEVLGGILLSRLAQMFVEAYAVRMRGGTLRFQAQYLRRIRVPRPDALDSQIKEALAEAFRLRDVDGATQAALCAYGISYLPDR
ncbi:MULTISPECIES: Eco57I restriction-modification methylase domain-containing protein [Streptomyces]|uniref:Eco57I restriction-modification methylase domain-containing protein n=1 Tax=Streptomyces TaxID=1883 RepID=UPI000A7470F9|nr:MULTISPECIES: N-6 DNA methylase [unclassified Streptomyces]